MWRRMEVAWHNGKFSQRSVLISGRQRFYTWPEHIGNSSRSSSVLTPAKQMEEERGVHFCLQFEERDTHLWKSGLLPGGASAVEQMSQSQKLKAQSHCPFLSQFFGQVEDVGGILVHLMTFTLFSNQFNKLMHTFLLRQYVGRQQTSKV